MDVQQLEVLAAESQTLVDRAMAMVKANALASASATGRRTPVEDDATSAARGPKCIGADVADKRGRDDADKATAPRTGMSKSVTVAVDRDGSTEPPG